MAEQVFDHKKLGLRLVLAYGPDDLRQRDVEKFMAGVRKHGGLVPGNSTAEYHGRVLRAGIDAGWVKEPAGLTVDNVGDLRPAAAAWYATRIDELYAQATAIPKDS